MTALAEDLGFLLSRASGLVVRTTNGALAGEGLRVRQYSVLTLAAEAADGITQRDLAEVLGLDPSQVVVLVDELAGSGLVTRRPSATDRRTKLVVATDDGRQTCRRAAEAAATGLQEHLGDLDADEQDLLRSLLQRVVGGLDLAVRRPGP
jgi:DNA-binding MarR family transcriptional regulator